ncbi:MAG: DUF1467 family protein [Rhodobiaceae bacterium]|nr:DUF1467 family protein [Rhodobiaceae bacterium]
MATYIASLVAVYFVVWWICFMAVLPWGVRSQHEEGEVVPGTEAGAPVAPKLVRKAIVTSIIAAVIVAAFIYLVRSGLLTLDMMPGMKEPPPAGMR